MATKVDVEAELKCPFCKKPMGTEEYRQVQKQMAKQE